MIRVNKVLFGIVLLPVSAMLISAGIVYDFPKIANVQLGKQNVFYSGVDNPVSISIYGIAPASVIVTSPGCDIAVNPYHVGSFIVKPGFGWSTKLKVSYVENGDTINAGVFDYRIKKIPDPVTYVGAIRNEGIMLKNDLRNISGVFTRMENFDFDCSFKPQSFTMTVFHDSTMMDYMTTGPALNAEMKTALHNAMPEDRILFHNVTTMGSDSTLRKTNAVLITVK